MKMHCSAVLLLVTLHTGLANAAESKPPAGAKKIPLSAITNKQLPFSITLALSSLQPLAAVRTHSGEEIKIYKISEKYGECEEAEVSMKADNCPRSSILISTMLDREGGSQFKLYKTPAHLNWVMPDARSLDHLSDGVTNMPYQGTLLACEEFPSTESKVNWRFAEYQLRVTRYDQVELFRMPDQHRYAHCAVPESM